MNRTNYEKHSLALYYTKDIIGMMDEAHRLDFMPIDEQIDEVCSLYSAFIRNDYQHVIDGLKSLLEDDDLDDDLLNQIRGTIVLLEYDKKEGVFA